MFRLCYISSAKCLVDDLLLDRILTTSRRRNRADGISGLLLAGPRRFLQLLEGDVSAVRETYQRIRRDPRHFACVLIDQRAVERRHFGE